MSAEKLSFAVEHDEQKCSSGVKCRTPHAKKVEVIPGVYQCEPCSSLHTGSMGVTKKKGEQYHGTAS